MVGFFIVSTVVLIIAVAVRVRVRVVKSMKDSMFMEVSRLYIMLVIEAMVKLRVRHMLSMILNILMSYLMVGYDGLHVVLVLMLVIMYLRAVVDRLSDMVWLLNIMKAFVLPVTIMTIIQITLVRMRFGVIEGMKNGVLSVVSRLNIMLVVILMVKFRKSYMSLMISNIVMNFLMFRIVLLLVISGGSHVHNRVKKVMLFVIWFLAVEYIGPVVIWLLTLKVIVSTVEVPI